MELNTYSFEQFGLIVKLSSDTEIREVNGALTFFPHINEDTVVHKEHKGDEKEGEDNEISVENAFNDMVRKIFSAY